MGTKWKIDISTIGFTWLGKKLITKFLKRRIYGFKSKYGSRFIRTFDFCWNSLFRFKGIKSKNLMKSRNFLESAKLRALRAKNMLTCQCVLRVYVLTCQRALRAYILTYQRDLRAPALTCHNPLCPLPYTTRFFSK